MASQQLLRVLRTIKDCQILGPHLPTLLWAVLTALTDLEPEVLSYLSHHADGDDAETLQTLRVSVSKATPLQECLEISVGEFADSNAKETVETLRQVISKGLGLPTKGHLCFQTLSTPTTPTPTPTPVTVMN